MPVKPMLGPPKPIKPTSRKTESQLSLALEDNEAEREVALERMARQREARLSAGQLLSMKNRSG